MPGNASANHISGGGISRPAVQLTAPGSATLQFFGYKGYLSMGDSWVDWKNRFIEGAEEKWNYLESLYKQVKKNLYLIKEPEDWVLKEMSKLEGLDIGISEYDTYLKVLYKLNLATDPQYGQDIAGQQDNIVYNKKLFQVLEETDGAECPLTTSKQVEFAGEVKDVKLMRSLLCHIYSSSFGREICDHILFVISKEPNEYKLTFEAGTESKKRNEINGATIELALYDHGYASDQEGRIIVNSLEIVTVHELGHLVQDLDKKYRGTPEKAYKDLSYTDREKWSDEEEYVNINQVENRHRDSLKVPRRKFHAGDPMIHSAGIYLKEVLKNYEELNNKIVIESYKKGNENELLFSFEELSELPRMKDLLIKEDKLNEQETAEIRWLLRRGYKKIESIYMLMELHYKEKYKELEKREHEILLSKPAWRKRLIPATGW